MSSAVRARAKRPLFASRGASIALMVGALGAVATDAAAADPSVNSIGTILRLDPQGNQVDVTATHPSGLTDIRSINFRDCEENLTYQVNLQISPSSSASLEAWAGTSDCTDPANRGATNASCWKVTPEGGLDGRTNPSLAKVRIQDILAKASSPTGRGPIYNAGDETACSARTDTGPTQLNLQFFFRDSASDKSIGTVQTIPLTIDTRAATVSGDITLEVGDGLLFVNVPGGSDTDTKTYRVYCDPPPLKDGKDVDAGVSTPPPNVCTAATSPGVALLDDGGDAAIDDAATSDGAAADAGGDADTSGGTDAATSTDGGSSTCVPSSIGTNCTTASNVIYPGSGTSTSTTTDEAGATTSSNDGKQRILPDAFLCGSGGVTETRITVKNLKNDQSYHVAVAASDSFGNVGPLSNVVCETPQPIIDFWDQYRSAGGQAGGGFCALEGVGMPAGSAAFAVGMIGAAVAFVRRRKRG